MPSSQCPSSIWGGTALERLSHDSAAGSAGEVVPASGACLHELLARADRRLRRIRRSCSRTTTRTSAPSRHMAASLRGLRRPDDRALRLGKESMVVEVAANDGYLLQYVQAARHPVPGHRADRKHRARPPATRASRSARSSSVWRSRNDWSPKVAPRISPPRTTCSRTCRTSTTSSRGFDAPAEAARRRDLRVPAPDAACRVSASSTLCTTSTSATCR